MSKRKIENLKTTDMIAYMLEASKLQSEFTETLFKLAKKYNVDEFDVMNKAATIMLNASKDPFFKEYVAPTVWDKIESES